MDAVHDFLASPGVMTVVIAVSCVALVIVAVMIVRRLLRTGLVVKAVFNDMVSGTGDPALVKASAIPDLTNGSEFGYSLWVYLRPGPGATVERLLISHPVDGVGVSLTLSPSSNTLRFVATGVDDRPSIKYLPMARWVHIAAVYANGTVTFFMDGEVHSVHAIDVPMTFKGPSGAMTVGGGSSTPGKAGFPGYVGYVTFINFYPSPGLIKRLYNQGPTPNRGFLSLFGMLGYGLRSPVYKIDKATSSAAKVVAKL